MPWCIEGFFCIFTYHLFISMSKILALVSLFLCVMGLANQGIDFEKSSFSELLKKADAEDKLIFIDAYAVWCGPCKLMAKNVFPDSEVGAFYNSSFINVQMDMEKGEGKDLAITYDVKTFPHYLFLDSKGEVLLRGYGYLNKEAFLKLGAKALAERKQGSLKERFEKGETDLVFLMDTSKKYLEKDPEFAKKVSERYFTLKPIGPYSHDEIALLLSCVDRTADPNFEVLVSNRKMIQELLPKDIYESFESRVRLNSLAVESMDLEQGVLNEALFLNGATKLLGRQRAKEELEHLAINFYPSIGDFDSYESAALAHLETGQASESAELDQACYLFWQHIANPDSLAQAVLWATESIEREARVENTYILALLHQKLGNRQMAAEQAQIALALVKNQGEDPSFVLELLTELEES